MSDGLVVELRAAAPIALDVRFDCRPGELVALVGPSGAGKTTILRAIAGLHRVREGRVACAGETWFDGRDGRFVTVQRRRVGLVFQDYALFPHMTAESNVAAAVRGRPAAARRARARELLAAVHLEGLDHRYPAQLSGGQRQRVALARALARDPAALLLDEPFAAVDQVTRGRLQRELALLRRDIAVPIVLVTHDLEEAARLADRLCVLHHGRTLQQDTPEAVLLRPASPLVARLMDQPNLFDGVLRRQPDGRLALVWRGRALEVARTEGFRDGEPVAWMIPAASILLHRRGRPSHGERENPLDGTVAEMIGFGETTSVTMALCGGAQLRFALATHAARRNALAPGAAITVSLLADGIHLMRPHPAYPG